MNKVRDVLNVYGEEKFEKPSYVARQKRFVLFEKSQVYYYFPKEEEEGRVYSKTCNVKVNKLYDDYSVVKIGSYSCFNHCVFNKGFDGVERYIICSRLFEAISK